METNPINKNEPGHENREKEFVDVLLQFTDNREKIEEIFKKLNTLYSQEGRYHHTLKHIHAMLSFLEEHKSQIKNWNSVLLATWYHDAVYDTQSKTNEEDSARLAEDDLRNLTLPERLNTLVKKLIITTKKHELSYPDSDSALFLDADLSILAKPAHVYDMYSDAIRKEYAWIPDDAYKAGRKAVLENFLQRDQIYFSPFMKEKETIARENMMRELQRLSI